MFDLPLKTTSGRFRLLGILALLPLLAAAGALLCGALKLSPSELWNALTGPSDTVAYRILWDLRIPRILLALAVGGGLAAAGTILQGVMRNSLASPDLIGVSAGGGLAAVILLIALPQWGGLLVPAAFLGALATVATVYLLAWKRGASPYRLVLSGVATAAMLGAFSSMILLLNPDRAGYVLDFTVGSFGARGWDDLRAVRYYFLAGIPAALCCGTRLNVLALGDETARGLGMRVERVRLELLALAALLAAAAVAAAGLLGFVGLIAPHLARLSIGPDHRFLLPAAVLTGAALVVVCDGAARLLAAPAELPAGMILALLGPPFFLWLLRGRVDET